MGIKTQPPESPFSKGDLRNSPFAKGDFPPPVPLKRGIKGEDGGCKRVLMKTGSCER